MSFWIPWILGLARRRFAGKDVRSLRDKSRIGSTVSRAMSSRGPSAQTSGFEGSWIDFLHDCIRLQIIPAEPGLCAVAKLTENVEMHRMRRSVHELSRALRAQQIAHSLPAQRGKYCQAHAHCRITKCVHQSCPLGQRFDPQRYREWTNVSINQAQYAASINSG